MNSHINKASLAKLPQDVQIPTYNKNNLKSQIAHIGFGAFHKSHQAYLTNLLAEKYQSDWGIIEISLMSGEDKIKNIKQQDYLYSVSEVDDDNYNTSIISVITEAFHPNIDTVEAIIKRLLDPEIKIISITATEKAYCYIPTTKTIDLDNPLIKEDILNINRPKSLPGLLVAVLKQRKEQQLPPLTIMSCDNMPNNGQITKNVVIDFAKIFSQDLADWITQNIKFPSTMVDRIAPAMTKDNLNAITEKLCGIEDLSAVICEPFIQWVIEDDFVSGRPQWEKVGVEIVKNVTPYEEMKLRMLNGSHSFLAYLGYLAGYKYVAECMQDDNFKAAVRNLMLLEQAPTLTIQNIDLTKYANSLIARFSNTGIQHKTWQIAMDGSLKLPQRMLESIEIHLENNSPFDYLALGVAGWIRYVSGFDDNGNTIEIKDPSIDIINIAVSNSLDGEDRVKSLLSINEIFGKLNENKRFIDTVSKYYLSIKNIGVKETMKNLLHKS